MNLDSVRDLKSSLLDTVLPGLSAAVRTRDLPGGAVQSLAKPGSYCTAARKSSISVSRRSAFQMPFWASVSWG